MSREKTEEELRQHEKETIIEVEKYIDSLIESENPMIRGKADKFSYWLNDYIKYLKYETKFNLQNIKKYKRGDVIKVNLGYNIGSEEGGLHYATVVDSNNSIHNPVVTVIPLTSLKPHIDPSHLKRGCVFLGNELYGLLRAKFTAHKQSLNSEIKAIEDQLSGEGNDNDRNELSRHLERAVSEQGLLKGMQSEISRMKKGSIGLVGQITTISKIRIYDPKTSHDVLSNIRLSSEKLDIIDEAIRELFLNKK